MPKLNLDIFHSEEPAPVIAPDEAPVSADDQPSIEPDGLRHPPKFVSVGFFPEDLRVLDEAVLELRKIGYWKASKSAIIRRLIAKHGHDLVNVFLEYEPPKR